ncbi:hypothetical protein BKA70DRAFT_1240659 [Coprinopsis sp. MPI-PUGE-AT-0042]|nr:hypothetical protein BKA70DRAFT_1240659 [Coprinopsis sp. MPI-PUGE-AT-0042]
MHRPEQKTAHAGQGASGLDGKRSSFGSVISGFGALTVMVPCGFLSTNLDIFCTSSHVERLSAFLQEQRYRLIQEQIPFLHQKKGSAADYTSNAVPSFIIPLAVKCIYTFQNSDGNRTVSLVCSASQSSLAPVLGYPTTALMNWVGGTSVGCAYPELTRLGEGKYIDPSLACELKPNPRSSKGFKVYERCTQASNHSIEDCYYGRPQASLGSINTEYDTNVWSTFCKHRLREINDRAVLKMAFIPGSLPTTHPHSVEWRLGRTLENGEILPHLNRNDHGLDLSVAKLWSVRDQLSP